MINEFLIFEEFYLMNFSYFPKDYFFQIIEYLINCVMI